MSVVTSLRRRALRVLPRRAATPVLRSSPPALLLFVILALAVTAPRAPADTVGWDVEFSIMASDFSSPTPLAACQSVHFNVPEYIAATFITPNGSGFTCNIAFLGIPSVEFTGSVRNSVYQAHLKEIYENNLALQKLEDPREIKACAPRFDEIDRELKWHGKIHTPAEPGKSKHEKGDAVDAGEEVIAEMNRQLMSSDNGIEEFVRNPLPNPPGACNLRWGGKFEEYDPVHFELP